MKRSKRKIKRTFLSLIVVLLLCLYYHFEDDIKNFIYSYANPVPNYNLEEIPEYDGHPYVIINNNEPEFSVTDLIVKSYETYSSLDFLGRCGRAEALIGKDLMPKEERGDISNVTPSGFIQATYSEVPGKYLYNRCHLIGFQLTGENDNKQNLITCTRQMNTLMEEEFESKVASYIKETNNHVLYRVTPLFDGQNLLASGVQMEALSVEDNGKGIKFNVYLYNVQDNITIDYKTGESYS